ncbi:MULTISPECIES: cupin domain-containing protein [unclassified Microbacterium]|uniref:cupin domain-containing protein n=1 Tax=unclassified Microbacterium TaxID=2609290 RepID=UPI003669F64C
MSELSRFHVRPADVPGFSPANHLGTVNRRLIGAENVGAQRMEVLLGSLEPDGKALPHAHPGMEQACYLLSGTATVEVGDDRFDMVAGEACFFPADVPHVFTVTGTEAASLLVIYSPPYGEDPRKTIRFEPGSL